MTEPLMEAVDIVQRLGRGAGQVRALKGVSLALGGGQLTLLMGPSGSGKTTLLSVLGCMLTPTEGTVRVRGQDTAGARPGELAKIRRDHIGFIFQSYRLFPMLTALDNVRLALDVRGERSTHAIAKSRDVLHTVGLSHKENAYPRELSGGEQQRVAIARAIVGDPAAILADEPTGALDSENGLAIMRILGDIAKDPERAVLVVTHDPRIVPFADRIVHIEDGLIDADSPPAAMSWPGSMVPSFEDKESMSADYPENVTALVTASHVHSPALGAFSPRLFDEAEDFEQHRGAVKRGNRAGIK
jgi:putative ABC transport system ATP-binding protein